MENVNFVDDEVTGGFGLEETNKELCGDNETSNKSELEGSDYIGLVSLLDTSGFKAKKMNKQKSIQSESFTEHSALVKPSGETDDELSDSEHAILKKHTDDTDNEDISSDNDTYVSNHVYISKQDGEVRKGAALLPGNDGSVVIVTPATNPRDHECHIRPNDLTLILVFSVISIFMFFPLGIAALIYAKKTSKAFYQGLEVGNLDDARNYIKISERLIIASIIGGLLSLILVISLVEKATLAEASLDNKPNTPKFPHGLH